MIWKTWEKGKSNSDKIGQYGRKPKMRKKSRLKCEIIWKTWKKGNLNCDKIWRIWKKGMLNSEKI